MICGKVMEKIEEHYPKRYALEWDNVGLSVGRTDKEVRKIYLALEVTDEELDEAINWGADMIVTHHPMIFKAMKKINDQDFIGKRVLKMIQNDISYYAMHTNYDVKGMADLAAEYLDLRNTEVMEVTCVEDGKEEGIGRVGNLPEEMTLRECCEYVKKMLKVPNVKVFGDLDQKVKYAAISPGSGKSVIKCALDKNTDVLITGDIDHHEGIDAVAQGVAIIDAGHYGTEYIYIEDMRRFCEREVKEVEVKTAPVKQPFMVV